MGEVTKIANARVQALEELHEEALEKNVGKFKELFRRRDQAKLVLRNIEREIEDLEIELEEE